MQTYTVDTEKVKLNAKHLAPRSGGGRAKIWISGCAALTAAAAAAAAMMFFLGSGFGKGVDITDDTEAAKQRLIAAEQHYASVSFAEKEFLDMYVSFTQPLTYNEIRLAFSAVDDDGEITFLILYDGESRCKLSGSAADAASLDAGGSDYDDGDFCEFNEDMIDCKFTGVKINAPASLCKDIRLMKTVSLLELASSGITDWDFVPFSGIVDTATEPAESPYSESVEIKVPETAAETTVASGTPVSETVPPETAAESETSASEETTDVSAEGTCPPESEAFVLPEGAVDIPFSNVETISFINENTLILTNSDSIRLCRVSDGVLSAETTFYASNAKVSAASSDGGILFITACDPEGRNRLYYADGEACALMELDIAAITNGSSAEIASVSCIDDGSVVLIKTVSLDKTAIYLAERSESGFVISLAGEFDLPAAPIAYIDGALYCKLADAVFENSSEIISAAGGENKVIASYTDNLKVIKSLTLDSALLELTSADGNVSYKMLGSDGEIIDVTDEEAQEFIAENTQPAANSPYTLEIGEDGNYYLLPVTAPEEEKPSDAE